MFRTITSMALMLGGLTLSRGVLAQTSDATLTVRLAVGATSQGAFNNGDLLATRVTVFARSGARPALSSATGIMGPTVGTARAGASFTVEVPRLYTPTAAGTSNPYTVEVSWQDTLTTREGRAVGIVALSRGANTVGPITIENDAPPAPASIMCYPNPPSTETDLYVYWSGPSPRPGDFDRFELHRSTTLGFVPSSSTLVSLLPWGVSNRVVTGGTPATGYYFCIRIYDQYGAFSDRCTSAPCRTDPLRDAGPDVMDAAMDVPRDVGPDAMDAAMDVSRDVGPDAMDAAMDVSRDVGPDAMDAALDAATDRGPDATDTGIDAPRDGATDVATDRGSDVAIDLGGMAGFTSTAPTSAPANTPYTYTPRAENGSGVAATMYTATGLPAGTTIDPRTGTITWLPGFADVGRMVMITVTATLPGGTTVRQSFTVTVTCPDNDGDGHGDARCPMSMGDDCDDARADTAPGAMERCNGIDDNCDGRADEGDPTALCGPGQSCDRTTRSCRPTCMSSAECTAAPIVCTPERVCALCIPGPGGNATACAGLPEGGACLADGVGGVFCGCSTDADCGARDSGRICDVARHTCIEGCSTASMRNGCPTGMQCQMTAGGVGTCTRTCTDDDFCETTMPGRPRCTPVGTPRLCLECINDGDCGRNLNGRRYCDSTNGTCVACQTGRATQCVASGAGAACLQGGVCGCNADSDCGGANSGRICDAFARVCRSGCRPMATTGNRCSGSDLCVMTVTGVGRCQTPASDAGPANDVGSDAVVADVVTTDGSPSLDTGLQPMTDVVSTDNATPNDIAQAVDVVDASVNPNQPNGANDGSCGCRATRTTNAQTTTMLLAMLAFVAGMRRRRR
jgi:MYXO-CTERM domain-containing protein